MAEAGEVGHWQVLPGMVDQSTQTGVAQLVEWRSRSKSATSSASC
jgi:hypothetical protein